MGRGGRLHGLYELIHVQAVIVIPLVRLQVIGGRESHGNDLTKRWVDLRRIALLGTRRVAPDIPVWVLAGAGDALDDKHNHVSISVRVNRCLASNPL
jgi:hypothetical protein